MTLVGTHWQPPTFAELRARPRGRTGTELIFRLREEGFAVTWEIRTGLFQVRDAAGRDLFTIPTDNALPGGFLLPALDLVVGSTRRLPSVMREEP